MVWHPNNHTNPLTYKKLIDCNATMSLAQHLNQTKPKAPPVGGLAGLLSQTKKPKMVSRNISECSSVSEGAYSMASSLRSSFQRTGTCRFTPSDHFTPEENAILLKLSEELNGLRQDGIMSIVEEFTLASKSTRRQSLESALGGSKRLSGRLSVASIPIFEDEGEEGEGEEKEEGEGEENGEADDKLLDLLEELKLEIEEEGDQVGNMMDSSNATHPATNKTARSRRKTSTRKRSTLLDMLGGKRQSTLQEMWQVGAENWKNNVDTILKGEWTGQLIVQDDGVFGSMSASDEEEEDQPKE